MHHHAVGNAIGGIEPKGGCDLAATSKVDHQVVGDISGGDAKVLGLSSVHVDIKDRTFGRLLYAGIRNARDAANGFQQGVGILKITRQIGTSDLNVNWRRCAEIQNLTHDVCRWKRKYGVWEFCWQDFAQFSNIVSCRQMAFAQSNLYVAVLGANHASVVVNEVNPTGWQADVVYQGRDFFRGNDLQNSFFNGGKPSGSLLYPRPNGDPCVDQNLSTVDIGKEVAAQIRQERKGCQDKTHEYRDDFDAVEQGQMQDTSVTCPKPFKA